MAATAKPAPTPAVSPAARQATRLPQIAAVMAPVAAKPSVAKPMEIEKLVGRFVARETSNVRRGPGAGEDRVGVLAQGEDVLVTGRTPDGAWFQVARPGADAGYVSSNLLAEAKPEGAEAPASPQAKAEDPQVASLPAAGGDVIKDCAACPELVAISPGSFSMGNANGDASERPERTVRIANGFAVGRFEVTVREWMACVDDGACGDIPKFTKTSPNSPARNISYNQAEAYVAWLTKTSGQTYRLPTEAEWEYAARGGTTAPYGWGAAMKDGYANCKDCGGDYNSKIPMEVGTLPANPFGLYDMNGGVAEWVADCWQNDHAGAPTDGTAVTRSNCQKGVLRGGSWKHVVNQVTASSRLPYDAPVAYFVHGLRVVRTLK